LLVRTESTVVDLCVATDPCPQRRPTGGVGCHRVEAVGRCAELARHLHGEVAEHVLLAREVLVEGDARAAGDLGDALDAALVVAEVAEHPQGGVEDALLGALPAGTDVRVVGERGAAQDDPRLGLERRSFLTVRHCHRST
jgi:hypothetical protein